MEADEYRRLIDATESHWWFGATSELAAQMLKVDVRTPGYLGRLTRWARANPTRVDGLYVSPLATEAASYLVAAVTAAASRPIRRPMSCPLNPVPPPICGKG